MLVSKLIINILVTENFRALNPFFLNERVHSLSYNCGKIGRATTKRAFPHPKEVMAVCLKVNFTKVNIRSQSQTTRKGELLQSPGIGLQHKLKSPQHLTIVITKHTTETIAKLI